METSKHTVVLRTEKDGLGRFQELRLFIGEDNEMWVATSHYETHGSMTLSGEGSCTYDPYEVVVQMFSGKIIDSPCSRHIQEFLLGV